MVKIPTKIYIAEQKENPGTATVALKECFKTSR